MESNGRISGESQIAHEILAYLAEHPHAQDTAEGIMEWWFLQREIERQTGEVKRALAELVARGLILETRAQDLQSHYRLNPNKQREIQALLGP